jgi:hypothetical protein
LSPRRSVFNPAGRAHVLQLTDEYFDATLVAERGEDERRVATPAPVVRREIGLDSRQHRFVAEYRKLPRNVRLLPEILRAVECGQKVGRRGRHGAVRGLCPSGHGREERRRQKNGNRDRPRHPVFYR